MYKIEIAPNAIKEVDKLEKSESLAYKKLGKLIQELVEHPQTGTGHPEQLGRDRAGQWSRRITQKHRLTYQIIEESATVFILSCYGHYEDK